MKLAPSILTADWTRLGEEIRMAQDAGADLFHLDVMDGHFVPNITFGPLMVGAIRRVTELPLDCHLMISQPELYIGDFVRAGADSVTVHQEACVHLHRVVHLIKDSGCRASVALNFATPIGTLEDILGDLDQVLIMSVDPGFGGQAFIPGTLAKIERMRRMLDEAESPAELAVDGGIKPENIGRIAAAGATIAVTGSAVFAPHHAPAEGLNKLREALSQARR